jgi:hypothetical protein
MNLAFIEDILSCLELAYHLLAITVDNASNNTTLYRSLQSLLSSQNDSWEAAAMEVNHMAHVVYLSIKALHVDLNLHGTESEDSDYDTYPLSNIPSFTQHLGNITSTIQKVCLLSL